MQKYRKQLSERNLTKVRRALMNCSFFDGAIDFREGDVIRVDRGEDGLVFSTAVRGEVVEV